MKLRLAVILILAQAGFCQEHWVATWGTAQLLVHPQRMASAGRPGVIRSFDNQTVRMIVRTSIPGRRVRVKLENAFGSAPVTVGAAHVGLHAKDSGIVEGSDRALSFNGKPECTVGPGIVLLSDPVELNVPASSDLVVSLYFPGETGPPTIHSSGLHTTYIAAGNVAGQAALAEPATTSSYYFLAAVDVLAPADASAVVALGDSITDGARSTEGTDHSWPALLAARLAANPRTAHLGVANMGISGNRVLRDEAGASALARFDRDVLSQSGVQWVILLEGINDIGREAMVPTEAVTADDLTGAYKQIIERAHAHGIKVMGCTLTPYEGANYYRETGEAVREAVNKWIRSSGAFDAVTDFEAAVRDKENPKRIRAEFDPGDHLHPNDAGYQAMADAVDLAIFSRK